MRTIPALLALVALVAPAQETVDAYAQLGKDYSAAMKAWGEAKREAAKVSKEKEAEVASAHPAKDFWPRYERLVAAGDGHGLVWMVEACEELGLSKEATVAKKSECVARLLAECANAEWAASDLVRLLPRQRVWFDEAWVREKLGTLSRSAVNPEVAAAACWELAQRLKSVKASDEEKREAERLLAKIAADYPGTKAAERLAEKRSASEFDVGGKPDFDALDPDGVAFKLSDYRGRVVMLDFWGFW